MVKRTLKNHTPINKTQSGNTEDESTSLPKVATPLHFYQGEPTLPSAQQIQWQFGDWVSLHELSLQEIEQYEAKAQLALIIAVAHLQLGNRSQSQLYIKQACQWGARQELCVRILSSGAHNSLGRTALMMNDSRLAAQHFSHSVALGTPGIDTRLVTPMRLAHQAMQLGIPPDQIQDWHLLLARSQSGQGTINSIDGITPCPLIQKLMAKLDQLLQKLVEQGQEMTLDGIAVFKQQDPFLPGKLALALAYWITEYPVGDARTLERCQYFHCISDWTQNIKVQTWGIDFYLRALYKLQRANLLSKCVSVETQAVLKKQLDWSSFLNKEDYSLKKRPSNFYGVAYSIAYHRYQLGWDDSKYADALLEKIIDHYQVTAGEFGFADETHGKGRYDRYSFLLIAEIAHQFREAELPLSQQMKQWLQNSANYVLVNLNKEGDGFQYGRSIGAYGDTAFIEILSAAAWFGVISKEQEKMAYHFCCLSTEKFLTYWWDEERGSVNLWQDGRKTEKYRGKHRILGENFSLLHQYLYVQKVWQELGYRYHHNDPKQYEKWLTQLPKASLTWLNRDREKNEQKAIVTWRDGDNIFNIPLVNGEEYYNHSTYLPIPYSSIGIKGDPDAQVPFLIPKIYLKNGKQFMPICKFYNIKFFEKDNLQHLVWEQKEVVEIKGGYKSDEDKIDVWNGITVQSEMTLSHGLLIRCDRFFGELDKIESIKTELINTFSSKEIDHKKKRIVFDSELIKDIRFNGYQNITDKLQAIWINDQETLIKELVVGWQINTLN